MPATTRATENDLLRLSDEQFARLESAARRPSAPGADRGREARAVRVCGSHLGSVVASLSPAAGLDVVPYRVRVLDLSRTGISFLHGAPVFPGTACEILARDASGAERRIRARVVRCRLVEGRAHEVGVRFDEPVSLDEMLGDEPPVRLPA